MKEPLFFTQEDFSFLSKWAEKVYDKHNRKHIAAKNYLMDTVWSKTEYWAKQLINNNPNLEVSCPFYWMERSWNGSAYKKKQVVRFKSYTWSRIFKKGFKNRDIFFTFGISSKRKAITYKLDYYYNNGSHLTPAQKKLCEQLIPEELKLKLIPFNQLHKYNWVKLLRETKTFLHNNITVYDEIVQSVWSGKIKVSKLKNRLIKRENNCEGLSEIPPRKFIFQGSDVNWEELQNENNDKGNLGEELVIEYEKDNLINKNFCNLAKEVKKVKDGKGYDIISRFESGEEKYIEVKTTTTTEKTPFPISLNEIKFSELNSKSYFLYRVFNLNKVDRVAEFHEYAGDLNKYFLFEGIQFLAFKKKNDNDK